MEAGSCRRLMRESFHLGKRQGSRWDNKTRYPLQAPFLGISALLNTSAQRVGEALCAHGGAHTQREGRAALGQGRRVSRSIKLWTGRRLGRQRRVLMTSRQFFCLRTARTLTQTCSIIEHMLEPSYLMCVVREVPVIDSRRFVQLRRRRAHEHGDT